MLIQSDRNVYYSARWVGQTTSEQSQSLFPTAFSNHQPPPVYVCRTFRRDRWRNHDLRWRQRTRAKMATRRFSRGFGIVSDERLTLDNQKCQSRRNTRKSNQRLASLFDHDPQDYHVNDIRTEMATCEYSFCRAIQS
jgi:hypothetical protein